MATQRKLRKLVVAGSVPPPLVDRLQSQFPDIEIVAVDADSLVSEIKDADAIVCGTLSDAALANAERLQWVHRAAAGVEHFMRPSFRERNLILTNSSGVSAPNMAEHVIALMLAFARQLPALFRSQQAHQWRDGTERNRVFEIKGQTVVVVGLGAIGMEVADRAHALGMRVIGVRRGPGEALSSVERLVLREDLSNVLPGADHIVDCLPLTAGTRAFFDRVMLGYAKNGAYFYNVGRGGTVDTDALIDMLRSGALSGAGLDVTDPEPLPSDSPLWDMPNVLVTLHTSGGTPHMWERVMTLVQENVARFQDGRPLVNVVDQDQGY